MPNKASETKRDPMRDPRAGDVVEFGPQWQRECYEVIRANGEVLTYRMGDSKTPTTCSVDLWRQYCAVGGEVLYVAPDNPRVVHCKRESFDVYIGRPSPYGNPFVLAPDESREEAIRKYREYLMGNPELLAKVRRELRGKVLGCWCAPRACHGDVLLEVANAQ